MKTLWFPKMYICAFTNIFRKKFITCNKLKLMFKGNENWLLIHSHCLCQNTVSFNYFRFWQINSASACNFIKKETLAQVFSCEFCEAPFLQNTSGRLLLFAVGCFNCLLEIRFYPFYCQEVYVLQTSTNIEEHCGILLIFLSDAVSRIESHDASLVSMAVLLKDSIVNIYFFPIFLYIIVKQV